jgi:glycosyltransferase involved in cell wall biosynthesis
MKLSVIIPVYNSELYIAECIESIVNQSYLDLEIIIVNDGSSDGSYKICQEYASRDRRIKIITQKNKGQSSARNLGLDNATGELITFIDSDDSISLDLYRINIELLLNESSIEIIQFPYYQFYGLEIGYLKQNVPKLLTLKEDLYKELLLFKSISWVVWDKIYRKEVFANLRFVEGMYYEDNYIIFEIIKLTNSLSLSNEGIYYYHARNNSLSRSSNSKEREFNSLKVNYLVYDEIIKFPKLELELLLIQNRIVNVSSSLLKNFNCNPLDFIPVNFTKKNIKIKSIIQIKLSLNQKTKMIFIKIIGFKLYFKLFRIL